MFISSGVWGQQFAAMVLSCNTKRKTAYESMHPFLICGLSLFLIVSIPAIFAVDL
jgi:hypothetical protein